MKDNKLMIVGKGWKIAADPENTGKYKDWHISMPDEGIKDASVPGTIQQFIPYYHGVVWYWNIFEPLIYRNPIEKVLVNFGRVDYFAQVWLNGKYLGEHEGGETPFEFDISSIMEPHEKNLLAVRVINPTNEGIDGFILNETPHTFKVEPFDIEKGEINYGGIMSPVEIRVQPMVRIADAFTHADYEKKCIKVHVEIENSTEKSEDGAITIGAGYDKSTVIESSYNGNICIHTGKTEIDLELNISDPIRWSPENPYLYKVDVRINIISGNEESIEHKYYVRTGFCDFSVREDGYFELNGKRLFLKSTHTVNNFPIGLGVPHNHDIMVRDLLYAKAMGFNMIRFLGTMANQRQLDFCDEIGLLVYEENQSSWKLGDSPKLSERFDRSLKEMIKRDRNHPSIVIWGLLNETVDGPVFRHAVTTLPLIRKLDKTRLVLLSSGRWDLQSVGSVSNPGSDVWQALWGLEEDSAYNNKRISEGAKEGMERWLLGGFMKNEGDLHMYPHVPHNQEAIKIMRSIGKGTKPVFLSEYGVGSQVNAIRVIGLYEQAGATAGLMDVKLHKLWADKYIDDWNKYGFADVYPFPEDMLIDSERIHAEHRFLGYNAVRSNPRICGYNLTGIIDEPSGEGLMTIWKELKHDIMDIMTDCLSPLRWCLFVEPMHVYAGRPFRIEAVLVNEDILKPGEYPLNFKVWGSAGTVWEKTFNFVVKKPEYGMELPFALPVISEEIVVDAPSGMYYFTANMEKGGAPTGRKLGFYLSETAVLNDINEKVVLLGMDNQVKSWLSSHGVSCEEYDEESNRKNQIILIGDLSRCFFTHLHWKKLTETIANGSMAVFLDPAAFKKENDLTGWLPLKNQGKLCKYRNWVYRREDVAKTHQIFEGMQTGGIMDFKYYGQIAPEYMFEGLDTPDDIAAAAFSVGNCCEGGYFSGLITCSYRLGAGRFILNTNRILENLDKNPAADKLILNLIKYAGNLQYNNS